MARRASGNHDGVSPERLASDHSRLEEKRMQDREKRKEPEQMVPDLAPRFSRFGRESAAAFSDPIGNQDVGLRRGDPVPIWPES